MIDKPTPQLWTGAKKILISEHFYGSIFKIGAVIDRNRVRRFDNLDTQGTAFRFPCGRLCCDDFGGYA